MKIFLSLIVLVKSQLVVQDTEKEYEIQPTLYGFIPYGGQIIGNMEFVKDLCKTPESTNKIIITDWSKDCKTQQQLWNADQALAVVFSAESINERELLSERYSELDTILLMSQKDIEQLKKNDDSKVRISFPIKTKLEKPVIEYIIYELIQTTEVLKMLQEFQKKGFNFYLNILYFTTHRDDIDQLCSAQATDANPYAIVFGDKVNCHSDFEKKYLIAGNLTKIDRSSILRENVLQLCVLKLYGQDKWLQYRTEIRNYIQNNQDSQTIIYQARNQRQQLQMDETKIQQCQTASYSADNKINSLLQEQDGLCFGLSSNHYKKRATLVINVTEYLVIILMIPIICSTQIHQVYISLSVRHIMIKIDLKHVQIKLLRLFHNSQLIRYINTQYLEYCKQQLLYQQQSLHQSISGVEKEYVVYLEGNRYKYLLNRRFQPNQSLRLSSRMPFSNSRGI